MNLKKSDKLIAIVAVVVLIIAAVGIVFYTETDDGKDKSGLNKDKYYTYDVVYEKKVSSATPDNTEYFVKNKLLGADTIYNGTVEITDRHVKQITFKIDYKDNFRGFLIKSAGADTLTITISGTDMSEQTESIAGEGNVTIFSNQQSALRLDSIKAKDDFEAREKLNENLSLDSMEYTYSITASLKQGEKLFFKPIKWLLEKLGSDSFNVEITYEYYDYSIDMSEEFKDTANNEMVETNWSATPFNSMNYVGYH